MLSEPLAGDAEPVLKAESRVADGAPFHGGHEVQDVAANAAASRSHTRIGVARPSVFRCIDNEALPAVFRCVSWQGTASTKVTAIKAVQHDAIMCQGHFHRHDIL